MACLAWIASELGSATSFPKRNIIQQNPWADERPSIGCPLRCLCPPNSTPLLHPTAMFTEQVNSRLVDNPEVIAGNGPHIPSSAIFQCDNDCTLRTGLIRSPGRPSPPRFPGLDI